MAFNRLRAMSPEEKMYLRYKKPHVHNDYLDKVLRDMRIKYKLGWNGSSIIEQDKQLFFDYIENDFVSNDTINITANTNVLDVSMKEEVAYTDGKTISINKWLIDHPEMAKTIIAHEFGHIYLEHFSDYHKRIDVELYRITEKRLKDILVNTNSIYNSLEGEELVKWLDKNKQVKRSIIKQFTYIIRGMVYDFDVNDRLLDEDEYLSFFVKQMPMSAFIKLLDNEFNPVNTPIVPSSVGSNRPWDMMYNANLIIDHAERSLPKIDSKDDDIGDAIRDMMDQISSLLKDMVSQDNDSHLDNLPDQSNSNNNGGGSSSKQYGISKNNNNTTEEEDKEFKENQNHQGQNQQQQNQNGNGEGQEQNQQNQNGGVGFANVQAGDSSQTDGDREREAGGSSGQESKDFDETDQLNHEKILSMLDDLELPEVEDTVPQNGCGRGKSNASAVVKLKEPIEEFYDLIVNSSKKRSPKRKMKRDPIKLYNSGKLGRANKVLIPKLKREYTVDKVEKGCRAIFVVDVSSSMSADEISKIVSTVHKAFSKNKRNYDFTIITWNTDLVRVLDLDNLEKIEIGGGTDIASGIKYAIENFHESKDDNFFVISDFDDYLSDWDREMGKSKYFNLENTFAVKTSNGVRSQVLKNFKEISLIKK